MSAIPRRVRAWGRIMDRFASMHVATMSPADIAHNQTMQHVPAPVRRLVFGGRHRGVVVDDRAIPTLAGDLPVRIYRPRAEPGASPTRALPIVLYFHGGGWTLFGALDMCDWLPSRVAAELGAVVIAVDYRLAPEHPFPAAVDDAFAALEWAAAEAGALGGDPARLAVIGDSAGGNLSAVVAQLARDRGGPAVAAQALIYPVTDTVLDDRSMRLNATNPVLHQADMRRFLDLYLGPDAASPVRVDARAAPLRAENLGGLPPALVQVAAHDVLRDQGIRYAERLRDAGNRVDVQIYGDAAHGWVTYPHIMPTAKRAAADLVAFLRAALGG
ncbi:hypothetical protein C5B96_10805 [Subtercola sp. Z020]|uniref:alpha/beta hydrolase n=1 Tax=Subtercola sp. Z020 TaxID=2080582 RepID=UPI000CE752BF|nr:alpha/beta hydrolase [Subtercola sp. Z020]PPF80640.1 hypothetical protein C5B96_10805 [Subtercola sp. Z020]